MLSGRTGSVAAVDALAGVAGVVNPDGRPTGTLDLVDADVIRYEYERDDDETIWRRPGVWHRSTNACDPTAEAGDIDGPVFVVTAFGADEETQPHLADLQQRTHEQWADADLPAGTEVTQYEGLDHSLQEGYAPRSPLSVDFGGNVSADVVTDLADWLHATAGR